MAEDTQVMCKFVTRLPEEYRVPSSAFAVPGKLTRYGLSEVINHLLALDQPRPFDFIVDSQLVRGSLEKLVLDRGLSAETVTTVEYIPAVSPPTPEAKSQHEDWISSVDSSHSQFIVSGSYDGVARVWTPGGKPKAELVGHEGSVKAVAVLRGQPTQGLHTLTASTDCTVRLWEVVAGGASVRTAAVFAGHRDAVDAVASAPDGASICTGSADTTVGIWKWDREATAAGIKPAGKRQKTTSGSVKLPSDVVQGEMRLRLEQHTDAVGAVCWNTDDVIYTGSMDRHVHKWDAETGKVIASYVSPKAVLSVHAQDQGLVAVAGADKALHLWDPRQTDTVVAAAVLSSHTNWVTCVRWAPGHPHHLMSASHDATVKLWDIRGQVPLHTVTVHTDKVFAVDLHAKDRLVSGGADRQMHICKLELQEL